MRLAALAGLVVSLALAQAPAQQPVPKFRTGVDVVLLDVTVLDRQRRPVHGLTAADFTILEDGTPQPIVSFEELDSPEPDGSLVPWMREVAPDVRTNAAENRRIVLLVLDDANISVLHTEAVKKIGRRIVEQLGPADQAAVIYTGNNAKSQEFTGDRAVLRRAVERYADTSMPPQFGMSKQYALQTVRRATQSLLSLPNRRKALIFVSSLAVHAADPNSDHGYQLQQALQQAQRANVTIYPINPAGLEVPVVGGAATADTGRTLASTVDAGLDPAGDTAHVMAAQTGGFAVTRSNTFESQIRQIFRETGSYYLLGFQSAHTDGRFRRLEVRTSREGLTVRTRNGYHAAKPEKNAKAEKSTEPLDLVKALGTVLPTPDVPMRVVVAPFAGAGKRAVVAIALGVQQPAPSAGEAVAERVELLSTAFDMSHRQRGAYRQTVQLKLRPAEGSGDAKYEILSKLELEPGRYQLRFAARSALFKKSGSVYQDIEVPDFSRAPLSLSGVVLGVDPSLASAPKDFLASLVPVAPTTQRTFLKGHHPKAFVRIYQGGKKPLAAVTMTTTLLDERDRTVYSGKISLAPAHFGSARAGDHRFDVPIDGLPPGAYLLRFEASAGKETAGRDVRFVVR